MVVRPHPVAVARILKRIFVAKAGRWLAAGCEICFDSGDFGCEIGLGSDFAERREHLPAFGDRRFRLEVRSPDRVRDFIAPIKRGFWVGLLCRR